MAHVLVAYTTWYGSTASIAEALAARIRISANVKQVDVMDIGSHEAAHAGSVKSYDAVVIGSPLHGGQWLHPMHYFVRHHAAELRGKPLWAFTVGSVGETSAMMAAKDAEKVRAERSAHEPKALAELRAFKVDFKGHRYFAGAIDYTKMGFFLRHVFSSADSHFPIKDARDWSDVEAYADNIAASIGVL